MDANGNITAQTEMFGRRFRLISYLDPDVAVGVQGTADTGYTCGVVRMSSGLDPANTIFTGFPVPPASGTWTYLSIVWDRDQTYALGSNGTNAILTKLKKNTFAGSPLQCYTVTSPWFVLALMPDPPPPVVPQYTNLLLDCSESNTSQGNPILWFTRNGGDNQTWRATTVGPGLP